MSLEPKSRCSEYDTLDVSSSAVAVYHVDVHHQILLLVTSSPEYEEIRCKHG